MTRLSPWLGVAIVLVAVVVSVLAVSVYAEYSEYKSFLLNSDRYAEISGDLSFVVASDSGSVSVSGNSITVRKGWTIVLEDVVDNTNSGFKIWIGSDGWTNINNLNVEKLVIRNENGSTVYEFTDVEVFIKNTQADISSIYSTLAIYVPRTSSGWTRFVFNGTEIINGKSSDEIRVIGVRPLSTVPLNIDGNNKIYAEGVAETAYVNASEVPETGSLPLLAVALFVLTMLLANKTWLKVKDFGKFFS